jgi:hypothetical protein
MKNDRVGFRASGSWDEVSAPRLEERALPALIPWGLGDAEPAREDGLEESDAYLCVACWEWHHETTKPVCDVRVDRAA